MDYKKIVVSVYEVEQDRKVIRSALDIAKKFQSELTILHINTPRAKRPSRVSHILEPYYSVEDLERELETLNHSDVSSKVLVIEAKDPIKGIIDIIDNYDLLVIGHRNMGWLESNISDSTDEIIINEIFCDCLVVTRDE